MTISFGDCWDVRIKRKIICWLLIVNILQIPVQMSFLNRATCYSHFEHLLYMFATWLKLFYILIHT